MRTDQWEVVLGFCFIGLFATAFLLCSLRRFDQRWFLRLAVIAIPLPWIAAELGWVLSEVGRQPWAIEGVLPTGLAGSTLSRAQLWTTLIGFTLVYGTLALIEIGLIVRTVRRGPFAGHDDPIPDVGVLPGIPPAIAMHA